MPERILDRVPVKFQLRSDSQMLRQQLLDADPSLVSDQVLFREVYGLMLYNNFTALRYSSPEHLHLRALKKQLATANIAKIECVDGKRGGKQQNENPTHIEPGGFTKRAPRLYRRTNNESGGKYIPRSPFLRGGLQIAARDPRDLVEFVEGHFMKEPLKDNTGKYVDPYQPCGQVTEMYKNGEITDPNFNRGFINKLKEITVPAVTEWYKDCCDVAGKVVPPMVCLTTMLDTVTRGYVLDLDQQDQRSPLSVAELVKAHKGRIESTLGELVGEYGSKVDWFLDPEKITDLASVRLEITRGLMQEDSLSVFKDEVLSYLSDHYGLLTSDQRTGVLSEFADNAALVYLQGSAYGEVEHPYKWHNERCIVISPEGNPPFVYFPDIQSFVATPPEPERTITYANTMVNVWNHHNEEVKLRDPFTRMSNRILMFLTTPVTGELTTGNYNFISALNVSGDLFHNMAKDKRFGELYKSDKLRYYSLLYDYQTRVIKGVVNNCAIASR